MTPIQKKNMETLFNDDETIKKRAWFFNAFPALKEEDFHRYILSTRCHSCCALFNNDRRAFQGDALCGRCYEIIHNALDMEHLMQVKEYMKDKRIPNEIQTTPTTTVNRSVSRSNKHPNK